MASIVQCHLVLPSTADSEWHTVRWVSLKKAVKGAALVAKGYDEVTENIWTIREVYGEIVQDDQWYFHVVK